MKSTVTFKEYFFREDVTAGSALGDAAVGGYSPSDNIYSGPNVYAPGDARVPKLLKKGVQTRFGVAKTKRKRKKNKSTRKRKSSK
jgi:hypothetical protein